MSASTILFRGLDWLEVIAKFQEQSSHDAFLSDIERIFHAKPETIIGYLGKNWSIQFLGNNGYRRYLQNSADGFTLFLDNRSWTGIGNAWPLRIVLQKPSIPSRQRKESLPLLWSKPFEAMNEMLERINGFYGDLQHRVARVDLCVHWMNKDWNPKLEDHANFVTRLKKPLPVPDHNNQDHSIAGSFIFGQARENNIKNSVTSTTYWINRRVKDLPRSFDPTACYPELPEDSGRIWNTEFKVWTRFLKSRGIESLESLEENYHSLWVYLTTRSLSLRVPNKHDRTTSRWKVHPIWKDLQNAFGEGVEPLKRIHLTSTPLTSEQVIKRVEGKAKDFIVVQEDWQSKTPEERLEQFMSQIKQEWFTDDALRSRIEKRDLGKVLKEATDK